MNISLDNLDYWGQISYVLTIFLLRSAYPMVGKTLTVVQESYEILLLTLCEKKKKKNPKII